MFRITHFIIFSLLASTLQLGFAADKEGFPGREKYPDIPFIEINDLFKQYKTQGVVIVDARSNYEYQTLSIKGAINIPIANKTFESEVQKLRNATDKPIVFYCNGHRCFKSYQSVKKAIEAGIKNTIAFDAGIFDWTKKYPNDAVLLGKSPVDPKHLIASKDFKSRLLDPDTFSEFVIQTQGRNVVVDVRDKFQRAAVGFYPGIERWAALDDQKKLQKYIKKAVAEDKTLFIYDEVGKQVRWLQYALERAGVKKYYFMDKGARAYYDLMAKMEWSDRPVPKK